jgi:hypothetical protein
MGLAGKSRSSGGYGMGSLCKGMQGSMMRLLLVSLPVFQLFGVWAA